MCLYFKVYAYLVKIKKQMTVLYTHICCWVSLSVQWSGVGWKWWIFIKQTLFLSVVAPPSSPIGLETKHTVVDQTQNQNNDLRLVVTEEEGKLSFTNLKQFELIAEWV